MDVLVQVLTLSLGEPAFWLILINSGLVIFYASFEAMKEEPFARRRRRIDRTLLKIEKEERETEAKKETETEAKKETETETETENDKDENGNKKDEIETVINIGNLEEEKENEDQSQPQLSTQLSTQLPESTNPNTTKKRRRKKKKKVGVTEESLSSGRQIDTIGKKVAYLIPVFASITLLLFFFFPTVMIWIMSFFMSLSSINGFAEASQPLNFMILKWAHNSGYINVKQSQEIFGGKFRTSFLVALPFAALFVLLYWITRHWIFNNILGTAMSFLIVKKFRIANLKIISIAFAGLFIYDIYWVFFSAQQFGESVMVAVATRIDLPLLIKYPTLSGGFRLLGLGDIGFPGLVIAFALKFDGLQYKTWKGGYFITSFIGYLLGLLLAIFFSVLFSAPQPALLYIIPATLGPLAFLAWSRGHLSEMWTQPDFVDPFPLPEKITALIESTTKKLKELEEQQKLEEEKTEPSSSASNDEPNNEPPNNDNNTTNVG